MVAGKNDLIELIDNLRSKLISYDPLIDEVNNYIMGVIQEIIDGLTLIHQDLTPDKMADFSAWERDNEPSATNLTMTTEEFDKKFDDGEEDITNMLLPIHPGKILLEEFLQPMGISQDSFAKGIAVSPCIINEIVHQERAISTDIALLLGTYFDMSPQFWENLQSRYDLEKAEDMLQGRLKQESLNQKESKDE